MLPQLTNEISILKVESVELITSLFGVHHVFIHHKGGSLGVIGNALAYLTAVSVSTFDMTKWVTGRWAIESGNRLQHPDEVTYRIGPNFPNRSNNSSGVTL